MIPVRTKRSNFVYRGPTPDIGDAWVERQPENRAVYIEWQPDDAERARIAEGGLLRLGIHGQEPIPPVSLGVVSAENARIVTADEPPKGDLRDVFDKPEVEGLGKPGLDSRPPKPPTPPRDREVG